MHAIKNNTATHCWQILLGLMLLFNAKDALVNQTVNLDNISLEAMTRNATDIYVVIADRPFMTHHSKQDIPTIPAFSWPEYHFIVKEVIKRQNSHEEKPPFAITVSNYDEETYQIFVSYYRDGIGKSPIIESYKGSALLEDATRREIVIFLAQAGGHYFFHNPGAFENVNLKPDIDEILRKSRQK